MKFEKLYHAAADNSTEKLKDKYDKKNFFPQTRILISQFNQLKNTKQHGKKKWIIKIAHTSESLSSLIKEEIVKATSPPVRMKSLRRKSQINGIHESLNKIDYAQVVFSHK